MNQGGGDECRPRAGGPELGQVSGGEQKAESVRPRPVERGQPLEKKVPVSLQAAADQFGERPCREANGGSRVGQGVALILSMTRWVTSSVLSTAMIRPSLALTSKMTV